MHTADPDLIPWIQYDPPEHTSDPRVIPEQEIENENKEKERKNI